MSEGSVLAVPVDRPPETSSRISTPIGLLGLAALVTLGVYFLIAQIDEPPCCDASRYVAIAAKFAQEGPFAKEDLRTFAYPLLLATLLTFDQATGIPLVVLTFLVQLGLYFAAIIALVGAVPMHSRRWLALLYLMLCANIFVIPYAGVTLTDSIYTSLALVLVAWGLKIESTGGLPGAIPLRRIAGGIFLVSLAIVTRPAAVWCIVPVAYSLFCARRKVRPRYLVIALCIGASPLYFQMASNARNFGVASPFPVTPLGQFQIQVGIDNIKYGTWLGGGSPNNYYRSHGLVDTGAPPRDLDWYMSHLDSDSAALGLGWYFRRPLEGAKLLALKLVGAFDFDYLVPYPYRKPRLPWAASYVSLSLLWLGAVGTVFHLVSGKLRSLGSRLSPIMVVLPWGVVTLTAAPELRFSLPLVGYFVVVTGVLADYLGRTRNWRLLAVLGGASAIALPMLVSVAALVRAQSTLCPSQ